MLYIKELPGAGGRLIYSGRRESIRTKGEFFYAEIYRQETAFVSHDFILRIPTSINVPAMIRTIL